MPRLTELIEKSRLPLEAHHDADCSQWQITDDARVIATGIESENDALLLAHAVNALPDAVEALEMALSAINTYEELEEIESGLFEETKRALWAALRRANTVNQ